MKDSFKILSINYDRNGMEYISSIEHIKYPFYALQFHPEKIVFEWSPNRAINHSGNLTLVSEYFGNFFVDQGENARN